MVKSRAPDLQIKHPAFRPVFKSICELSIVTAALFISFLGYGILPNRWYHILYVYSGSMSPTIESGDVIIISPPPTILKPGMIVTLQVDGNLVTHRIVDLQSQNRYTTKGDANRVADDWGNSNVKLVGLYQARIPYLGYFFASVQDLLQVNGSGAWFMDREKLILQGKCSPKQILISDTITISPTVTFTQTQTIEQTTYPETLVPKTPVISEPPYFELTPSPDYLPTQNPELIPTENEGTPSPTSTLTPIPTLIITEESTPPLEPAVTETLEIPTSYQTESEAQPPAESDALLPTLPIATDTAMAQ